MTTEVSRRDEILACAAELFARKGVAATTVREIADAVGILSGSLYHHFESKEAMVDEIISSYHDDLRTRYKHALVDNTDPRQCLEAIVTVSLVVAAEHPHAAEIYQNDVSYLANLPRFAYLKSDAAEVQKTWLDVIRAGITAGVLRDDIDAKVFYRLLRDAIWLSVRWFKPTPSYPLTRFAEDAVAIFLDGYATR